MSAVMLEHADRVSMELTAKYFRTLGDPTRLRILDLLIDEPMTVSDLVSSLGLAQSRISNHLACLRWCGLVSSKSDGRWVTYSVNDPDVNKVVTLGRRLVSRHAQEVAACTRV